MSTIVLVQFSLSLLAALFGAVAGWWLRGKPLAKGGKQPQAPRKQLAAQVLENLQAAAETIRSCVEQHTDCIRAIQSELNGGTATEPIVITKMAESIIESNGLVQHQFNEVRNAINNERKEVRDCLANCDGLLFTFATLDRQQRIYRQVLSSLEVLAAELAGEIKGHGQRLKDISGELSGGPDQTVAGVAGAVTQILDATDDVQARITATQERIAKQAEGVQMQAILTHTDLLTSLPNRRALETELRRLASPSGRKPLATLFFINLDDFSHVNSEYGHQGGDVILRQAAGILKGLVRGRDMVARYCGDTFAVLLNQTTVHDALPLAERIRKQLQDTEFSHGTHPLRVTASIGIAQLHPEEMAAAETSRADQALQAAKQAGGNVCFRHDGENCHPVSAAFHAKQAGAAEESLSLAALWRDSTAAGTDTGQAEQEPELVTDPTLSGRTLFAANLSRRLAEWKRGGASVSVAVLRVDQMDELVARFGDEGRTFLRQVLGRLLEATTREMDERCEFEDGLFALLLPGADEENALGVADRLCSQVRQCKVRMGNDLWDLTASIGVAHGSVSVRVMDIMLSAEDALNSAIERGGDTVCIGRVSAEPIPLSK
jgi:diguanylate cyclase